MANKRNQKNHNREMKRAEKRKQMKLIRESNKPAKQEKMSASTFISDFAGAAFEVYTASEQMAKMISIQIDNVRKAKESDPSKWSMVDPTPMVDALAAFNDEEYIAATKEAIEWAGQLEDMTAMIDKVKFVESKSEAMMELGIKFNDLANKYQESVAIVQHMVQTAMAPAVAEQVTALDEEDSPVEFTPEVVNAPEVNLDEKMAETATLTTPELPSESDEVFNVPTIIAPVSIVNSDGETKVELTQADCDVLNETEELADSVPNTTELTPPPAAPLLTNEEDIESAIELTRRERDNPLYHPGNI